MPDYKETLNLPKTDFSMRAGLAQKEPQMLEAWEARGLYEQIQKARSGAPRYVLHDGPPYANGHLHHGHILNKLLKDFIVKDRTMAGFSAAYVPGWDCHGLPIEVQVDKKLGAKKAALSKVDVRRACREYASEFVDIQRAEFKRLGVFGRWDKPYQTMSFAYEAQTLRELAKVVGHGLLYKGLRPVNWCLVHQTALAEAEVEYEDHKSPSVYVAFEMAASLPGLHLERPASLVIWTTTPWTLPANLAVCLHPELEYVVYPVRGRPCVVARGRIDEFLKAVGEGDFDASHVLATFLGRELEGLKYKHPLFERRCPIVLGTHVTLEAGTGCVHTAPGHGADDFDVGRRYGLEVFSPVDGRGCYTADAERFAGKRVPAVNDEIVAELVSSGALLNKAGETIAHRYPHCWRCHTPIILRATEQWFVAMDRPYGGGRTLREASLAALAEVAWIPRWGEERIAGMLANRPDWCLSRQRSWGVPIAVFYCLSCNAPLLDENLMNQVADVFEREGSDAWFERPASDFVGDRACGTCGALAGFRKEEDILDVWFDSGVSFAAVVEAEGLGHPHGAPVDLYLEGSDQHRGWFHSSLLCALATRQKPPFRKVLTHGFVVDGKGKKISKSLGNFVDPFKTIASQGAELLRLWVAGEDYREDVRISEEILTRQTDAYRKIRNTVRFLLGSLHGFDPRRDTVAPQALEALDAYAVMLTRRKIARMREAFERFEFHVAVHALNELCTVDLSAFYLDVIKDRLYASKAGSPPHRSAQTAIYLVARDLILMMAPVLSFTADEAFGHLPKLDSDADTVHLMLYPGVDDPPPLRGLYESVRQQEEWLVARYDFLREVRRRVNASLEEARQQKLIGSSVEAHVRVGASAQQYDTLAALGAPALAELFIVSQVTLELGEESVRIERASGTKCERCWLYRNDVGQAAQHPTLCGRCVEAV